MKINFKYITLLLLAFVGLVACDKEELVAPDAPVKEYPALNTNGLDFSKYVSVGASFTAGFSDGALFKAAQESSFPALLATQFAKSGGGTFTQPLMSDNVGGIVASGQAIQLPRLYFYSDKDTTDAYGSGPYRLGIVPPNDFEMETPTTTLANLGGTFNNMGVPGAKSFHMVAQGYGNPQGVAMGRANPYYARFASSASSSMLGDALAQQPTFFTLSEVGGNDVLTYATSGGSGVDQKGNLDPSTYGPADITDPDVFTNVFTSMVGALTQGGAKGVIATVPYITDLPHFTTVPYNALNPSNPKLASKIATLNQQLYGPLDNIFTAYGEPDRINLLSATEANPILIYDENATDRSAEITRALTRVLGAQKAAAFGAIFGKARQATNKDLFVLPSSGVIATEATGVPAPVNVNGVSYPLQDKWVLTPQEQTAIKNAVDAYNITIRNVASSNANVALVDLNTILTQASTSGVQFGNYTMGTKLVVGGLVSLDGVHLTTKGYGLMAYKFLEAIDAKFGSNFIEANAVPMPGNLPTNYSNDFR